MGNKKIYTSQKGGIDIDDGVISSLKTYSSQKIENLLDDVVREQSRTTGNLVEFGTTGVQDSGKSVDDFADIDHNHSASNIPLDTENLGGVLPNTLMSVQQFIDYIDDNGFGSSIFHTGAGVPSSGLGVIGDLYIQSNGKIWKKQSGGWVDTLINITGPQGINTWGSITGVIGTQSDLSTALGLKANLSGGNTFSGDQIITGNIVGQNGVFSQGVGSSTPGSNATAFKSQNTSSGTIWTMRTKNDNNFAFDYFDGVTAFQRCVFYTNGDIGTIGVNRFFHPTNSNHQALWNDGTYNRIDSVGNPLYLGASTTYISGSGMVDLNLNTPTTNQGTRLLYQEGGLNKGCIEYLGTSFGGARQNNLEILTFGGTGADIVFRPNDVETVRFKSGGRLVLTGLPTSSAGLGAGDVWKNGSVLNIV